MTKDSIEVLLKEGKSLRVAAKELQTSYTNLRYHIKKFGIDLLGIKRKVVANTSITCLTCKITVLQGNQTMYCSKQCQLKSGNSKHQSYVCQQKRGLQRKLELISSFGGCCSRCGYSKNSSALAFHHKDPTTKVFSLDVRSLSNRTMDLIEIEAAKCILVCHNCHSELHHPHFNQNVE